MYSNNTIAARLYLSERVETPTGFTVEKREDGKYVIRDKSGYLCYGVRSHLTFGAWFIPIDHWRSDIWHATGFKTKQMANAYGYEFIKQFNDARIGGILEQRKRFRQGNYEGYR